jgi:hypothetical protein
MESIDYHTCLYSSGSIEKRLSLCLALDRFMLSRLPLVNYLSSYIFLLFLIPLNTI